MPSAHDADAEVAEALPDSGLPAPPLHPHWQAEIARRLVEMDAGRMRFVAAAKAMAALAARIESRRPGRSRPGSTPEHRPTRRRRH